MITTKPVKTVTTYYVRVDFDEREDSDRALVAIERLVADMFNDDMCSVHTGRRQCYISEDG